MMPKEATMNLRRSLARWQESLHALETTLRCDQPEPHGLALADALEQSVMDSNGWIAEALQELEGNAGKQGPQAATVLAIVHAKVIKAASEAALRLRGFDQVAALASLWRERGVSWGLWAEAVRQAMEPLADAERVAHEALASAWAASADAHGATRAEMALGWN